jgi:hypothetical protein
MGVREKEREKRERETGKQRDTKKRGWRQTEREREREREREERESCHGQSCGLPRQGKSGLRWLHRWQSSSPHSFFWRQKWQQIPV